MTRSLEEIQWRNIHKVVNALADLADLCFGDPKDPQYGIMHVAITTSLTAKDGLGTWSWTKCLTRRGIGEDHTAFNFSWIEGDFRVFNFKKVPNE